MVPIGDGLWFGGLKAEAITPSTNFTLPIGSQEAEVKSGVCGGGTHSKQQQQQPQPPKHFYLLFILYFSFLPHIYVQCRRYEKVGSVVGKGIKALYLTITKVLPVGAEPGLNKVTKAHLLFKLTWTFVQAGLAQTSSTSGQVVDG